ncbi:MAG: hypothetical protein HQ581_18920, partial [Planctomycetes bacterium]|nr:hypothetical protein [Planctomycetota bacterium]
QPGGGEGKPPGEQEEQNPARKRIQAAQEKMEEAKKKLEEAQRDGAVEDQEKAIEELEQAKAELEEILRQLREEEIERMLALLEARFRKMLRLQQVVYEGTLRLRKVEVDGTRTAHHEIEARRLSQKENDIVLEADKALTLLQEDGTAIAFPEALRQVRLDMVQVSQRLVRYEVGEITQVIEEDIIAALEEMIEALQKAQEEMEDEPPPGEPPPPGPPQDMPLVDLLAEVRMIRALQMRVNSRTERYSRLVEEEQAHKADLLEALDRLAEREARIHEITRDLDLGKNK